MRQFLTISLLAFAGIFLSFNTAHAQFKYEGGKVLMNTDTQYLYYAITVAGNGMYFDHSNGRFLQISVAAEGAPRLAGHNNQIVFYNSQTSTFNSIQVSKVYNYSDARAKTSIQTLSNGLDIISKLRPVTYNFKSSGSGVAKAAYAYNQYTGSNSEIGLLAQELETVLPNLVFTDDEGRKLVDYTALIPVLIDAVKTLRQEIEELKAKQ